MVATAACWSGSGLGRCWYIPTRFVGWQQLGRHHRRASRRARGGVPPLHNAVQGAGAQRSQLGQLGLLQLQSGQLDIHRLCG